MLVPFTTAFYNIVALMGLFPPLEVVEKKLPHHLRCDDSSTLLMRYLSLICVFTRYHTYTCKTCVGFTSLVRRILIRRRMCPRRRRWTWWRSGEDSRPWRRVEGDTDHFFIRWSIYLTWRYISFGGGVSSLAALSGRSWCSNHMYSLSVNVEVVII